MPENTELLIDDVVTLDPTDTTAFTPEHKTFLENHKDELTTEELTKFGLSVEPIKPISRTPNTDTPVTPEEKKPKGDAADEDETDEEEKKMQVRINRALEPQRKAIQETQDRVEVDTFVVSNPDFAKYKDTIMAHVKDPAYRNVPVDRIAKMVAADDLMKIGARREREATRKAAETRSPGNGARATATSGDPNWLTASREDFEAKKREVMGRRA